MLMSDPSKTVEIVNELNNCEIEIRLIKDELDTLSQTGKIQRFLSAREKVQWNLHKWSPLNNSHPHITATFLTVFTLSIGTPYLPTILDPKFEMVHSATSSCV